MIRDLITQRTAKRDAERNVNNIEDFLVARHGLPRAIDGTANRRDRQALADVQNTEIEDFREQLRRLEDEQEHHESATSLGLKIGACYGTEVLGCTLLFRDIGLSGIERIGLAAMFAAFIFFITRLTTIGGNS
jgi:hypothetical protein